MSSAELRPAGPRAASHSRGRSSAGISRIARPARSAWTGVSRKMGSAIARLLKATAPWAAAGSESPGPYDGSPPIPPAIRTRERPEQ